MKLVHNGRDITHYISTLSWGGSKSEVARKLEFTVVNAPLDKNITPLAIGLADMIYLYGDDGKTELFRGFVTDREAVSVAGTVTYTAYDLLFYTLKSKATYNFSSQTAEDIAKMVCADMEIPVGSLATTGLSLKLLAQNTSIYEIIMQAYTLAYEKNGIPYHVVAKKGLLNVEQVGAVTSSVELNENTNITSSRYKESIVNMVNKVRIYNDNNVQVGVVQNDSDVSKYGVFQQVYKQENGKDAYTTAKSMFNGVEKTFNLEGINVEDAVTGAGIVIRDTTTGLAGVAWIDADTHTWQNGVATMSLTVTLKKMMDTKSGDGSVVVSASSSNSTRELVTKVDPKNNPPYYIMDRSYKVIKANISSYGSAYGYWTNGGNDRGWDVYDADNNIVVKSRAVLTGSKDNPPYSILDKNYAVVKANFSTFNGAYGYWVSTDGRNRGWVIYDGSNLRVYG